MAAIAEACGVSKNAVSYALKEGHRGVSAATAERIREKAREMGYKRDPDLSRLARKLGRAHQPEGIQAELPFVVPIPAKEKIGKPLFFMEMCQAHAQRNGYHLKPYYIGPDHYSVARVQQVWESRGIQGVLMFNPSDPYWEALDPFDWDRFSWVTFSETMQDPRLHQLNWHFRQALDLCFLKLRQKGYRRIGMVMQEYYDSIIGHAGMCAVTLHHDRVPKKERVPWLRHRYRLDSPEGTQELSEWLQKVNPDAIVGHNQCLSLLQQLGMGVPEEVAFVDWRLQTEQVGKVTGILPAFATMGRMAIDLLLSQVEHQVKGIPEHPVLLLIEGEWQEGATAPERS